MARLKFILLLICILNFSSNTFCQYGSIVIDSNYYDHIGGIADFDNDGDLDILKYDVRYWPSDSLRSRFIWVENQNFKFNQEHLILEVDSIIFRLDLGDIDNDSDIDIVYGINDNSYNEIRLYWLENKGSGDFDTSKLLLSNQIPNGTHGHFFELELIDFNNDNFLDIVYLFNRGWPDQYIDLYINDGLGNYLLKNSQISATHFYTELNFGDLNNDNKPDLLTYEHNPKNLVITKSFGDTLNDSIFILGKNVNNDYIYNFIDYDDDLDLDILASSGGNWRNDTIIKIYQNLGNFQFQTGPIILIQNSGIEGGIAFDYDSDSDQDIISFDSYDNNNLVWFENLGNGNFGLPKPTNISGIIDFADFDNDGDLDFVSISRSDSIFRLHKNFNGSSFKYLGHVFFDENQNGVRDTNEINLKNISIQSQPDGASYFTKDGRYEIKTNTGQHTISFKPNKYWQLTTDSISYTATVDNSMPVFSGLDFGFYADTIIPEVEATIVGSFPRCNLITNIWVNLKNKGTTLTKNELKLDLDSSIQYVNATVNPISINGNTIRWSIDSLDIDEEFLINLSVRMPDFRSIGNILKSELEIETISSLGSLQDTTKKTQTLLQELRCAYDPNDKQKVLSAIESDTALSLNKHIEYLIRFQNTGNDTAISVLVTDQLDQNLNWESFNVISSSHPVNTRSRNGEIEFRFDNIFLVDSNTNEPESHGYIKYSILPKSDLLPNTLIENTANIFFDFNPPIITNTTKDYIACYDTTSKPVIQANSGQEIEAILEKGSNYVWYLNDTLIIGNNSNIITVTDTGFYKVSALDSNQCLVFSDQLFHAPNSLAEINLINAKIYPNPAQDAIIIESQAITNKILSTELYDLSGKRFQLNQFYGASSNRIQLDGISTGNYFLIIRDYNSGELLLKSKISVIE